MKIVRNSTLLFILVLVGGCNYTMHPELAGSGVAMPPSDRCQECHTVIYEEWRNSPHSRAYTNKPFKDITASYKVTACLPCHAPESVFGKEKKLRETRHEEGVNCQSCHLVNGVLQGPVEQHLPFNIHPIKQMDTYRKSEFCGKCHSRTFAEYKQSGRTKKTCQECHMPTVRRTIIDNKPWVWAKDKYDFRRHSFNVMDLEEIGSKIGLSVVLAGQHPPSGQIVIENREIPHNIPTGTYGYHEIRLNLYLLDDLGEPKAQQSFSFTQEMKTAIKPGEKRVISFAFSDQLALPFAVKAVLIRADMDQQESHVISQRVEVF